jgi:hypothetical protein
MNKGIMFFVGLLIGLMVCASIYYIDKYVLKPVDLVNEGKSVVLRVDTVYVEVAEIPKKQTVEPKSEKLAVTEEVVEEPEEEQVAIVNADFSFDETEQDDVFLDKLLQSRILKAVLHPLEKKEGKRTDDFFYIFELQQWSTPIKNKLTYSRYQTLVKVKGLDIKNANVVFWNENFYLEVKNRYYLIPETDTFEKLTPVTIP